MSKEKLAEIQKEIDIRGLILDVIDHINYINRTGLTIKSIMNILEHEHHVSQQQIADKIATETGMSNKFILDVINGELEI